MNEQRQNIRRADSAARKLKAQLTAQVAHELKRSNPRVSTEPRPRISAQQLNELRRIIREIAYCFHYKTAAEAALYAAIRQRWDIPAVAELPPQHFGEAMRQMEALSQTALRYLRYRADADRDFIDRSLTIPQQTTS